MVNGSVCFEGDGFFEVRNDLGFVCISGVVGNGVFGIKVGVL